MGGPKMTFGGGERKAETTAEPAKPKPAPKKKEDGPMNERKWVFDTIQKYFDVIVEEEKEEDEEEEDEEGEEEDEDDMAILARKKRKTSLRATTPTPKTSCLRSTFLLLAREAEHCQ